MKTGAGAASKAGGRASASGGDGGAAGGRAGRKVKEAQDASAAPAQEEGLNKALQAKPYKKFDEKTQTWKTVFITPEAPAEPVDYKKLYDVPDCPVFYPTAKEFNHPGKYIESISEQARPFGICKIVPPPTWKPPFMIDHKNFTVRTRVQQVNYLDGQARQRLIFVENLCRFWSKRGQELEKLPVIAQAPLDVCRLYHEVRLRGGMATVTEKKQWSDVSRAMDMGTTHGSALRTQYMKILLPFEEWKDSTGEYRVKGDHPEEEQDDEEAAALREQEHRARQEKEERERRKKERQQERVAQAVQEVEDAGGARVTRRRAKVEGLGDEEESVTFTTEGGLIGVGSKVSVYWDGDGVSYKGVVVQTCERRGCKVVYDADGEKHWEDPEVIRFREDDTNDEGDLPLLNSVGGQGTLAMLDNCLGAGSEMTEVFKAIVKREAPDASEEASVQKQNKEAVSKGHTSNDRDVDVARPVTKRQKLDASATAGTFHAAAGQADGPRQPAQESVAAKVDVDAPENASGAVTEAGGAAGRQSGRGKTGGKMGGGRMGGGRAAGGADDAANGAEVVEGGDDEEYRFGYHDGNTYSLQSFRKMANDWKEAHFERSIKKTSLEDVEEEYWRVVSNPEKQVEVEYGSELHTTQHGSGFPTHGNALNPLDSKTTSSYCRSGWNLNNLNECTLLRFVKEDIPGIISPWLYMGMCFSTFCWHNEDHFLYSINYLWEGEPKQWYGVPGDQADLFEATMRAYAPQLFELQPDVLFQLVTMIAPSMLAEKGVSVCRARQCAGEFMVTFPRAYHGGFNMGYNVAESCNFALTDWIPWGLMSDRWYRQLGRAQVFSYPALLVSLAQDSDTVETAMWLYSDLQRYLALELQAVENLEAKGLAQRRRIETTAGILTNMLSANAENEVPNTLFDGKRMCFGRMKMRNLSMQDIRRQRDSQGQDECCVCLGSTFLFLVRCECSDKRVACVAHGLRMCECPVASKTIESRFSHDEMSQLVSDVRQRAERPAIWMTHVANLLCASSLGLAVPHMRTVQTLVTEAERFPRSLSAVWQRQDELKEVLRQGKAWAAQAQGILTTVNEGELKRRGAAKRNTEGAVSFSDIQKVIQEAGVLRAVPDELEVLQALSAAVVVWRDGCRELMMPQGQPAGLGHLDDAALQRLLTSGLALNVQVPELRKVLHESDLRSWLASLPAIPGSCTMARVQALLAEADTQKLQGAQVDAVRKAAAMAEITQSRVQKARGRGTSVASLESLLHEIAKEKASAKHNLYVELDEEQEIRKTLLRCEGWSSRAATALEGGGRGTDDKDTPMGGARAEETNGSTRPSLKDLEMLQDEYQSIGVYIEASESLRRRIETGQTWRRKALRIAPAVLSPPPPPALVIPAGENVGLEERIQAVEDKVKAAVDASNAADGAEAAVAAVAAADAAVAAAVSFAERAAATARASAAALAAAAAGTDNTMYASQAMEPNTGSKRGMSKRDREREANRLRKGECTAGPGSGVGPVRQVVPTTEQVLELLEEEAKLRVRVEEADALRARLQEHAQWADKARALLSEVPGPDDAFKSVLSACTALAGDAGGSGEHAANATCGPWNSMDQHLRLSAMLEKGELLGIALGEEGRKIQVLLWSIKTGRLLAAGTGAGGAEREELVQLQAQAKVLQVGGASPILVAIQAALSALEAQGCVCGSLQTKGGTLTCVCCHKKLHPTCLGIDAADPRISSAPNSYVCAPCRRKGRATSNGMWTHGEAAVTIKLPAGWVQTLDASGQLVFVQRASDGSVLQFSHAPPPSSVAVIPCAPNPCAARAPETAKSCQVCFEEDEMPGLPPAPSAGDSAADDQAAKHALAQEVAREHGALLECLECGLRVHEGCYLGRPHPEAAGTSRHFICRPCEFGVRSAACLLCGLLGGAMSPAACGGWVHVSCALWAPEGSGVEFEDISAGKDTAESAAAEFVCASSGVGGKAGSSRPRRNLARVCIPVTFKVMDGTAGKEGKDKRRSSGGVTGSGCQLCRSPKAGGALVKCQEKGCKMSAHPLCAFEHGWYLFVNTSSGQEIDDTPAATHADDGKKKARRERKRGKGAGDNSRMYADNGRMYAERLVFCQEHAPQEDEDETLYCICQTRYKEGEWMIECESCNDWFHGHCVGVDEKQADTLVAWHCPRCRPPPPPSVQPAITQMAAAPAASSSFVAPQAAELSALLLDFASGA